MSCRSEQVNPNATLPTPTSIHVERLDTCACNPIGNHWRASGLQVMFKHLPERSRYCFDM